jgi:hypothetical protein
MFFAAATEEAVALWVVGLSSAVVGALDLEQQAVRMFLGMRQMDRFANFPQLHVLKSRVWNDSQPTVNSVTLSPARKA